MKKKQRISNSILALVLLVSAPLAASCSLSSVSGANPATAGIPVYSYRVVDSYPHDSSAFTQGLVFEDGGFYESTGQYGSSSLRRVELDTGSVFQFKQLPPSLFAEGIALVDECIIQVTWRSHNAFVYNRERFEQVDSFTYTGEGWGVTYDGTRLIMSDGTSRLRFFNPETWTETGSVQVTADGVPVRNLNELEYVRGEVWANVWQTDRIARISPASGTVVGWIDLAGLLAPGLRTESVDVLNGIAYDPDANRIFVTGKYWPRLFEIELVDVE